MIGEAIPTIEARYAGQGYGTFKKDLAEATVTHLTPIQERLANFRQDPGELMRILDEARDQARAIACQTMKIVKERVGLGR
jgi:tryptophanyl-tRNA synthetase